MASEGGLRARQPARLSLRTLGVTPGRVMIASQQGGRCGPEEDTAPPPAPVGRLGGPEACSVMGEEMGDLKATTRSSLLIIDLGPSLSFKLMRNLVWTHWGFFFFIFLLLSTKAFPEYKSVWGRDVA